MLDELSGAGVVEEPPPPPQLVNMDTRAKPRRTRMKRGISSASLSGMGTNYNTLIPCYKWRRKTPVRGKMENTSLSAFCGL
jgi:hypothetical protein